MRRRGSQTSIMLTQEEKNNAMPQSDQERRRSMNQDMSNGGGLISPNQQYPPQQVAQPLPMEQQFQNAQQQGHIVQPQNSIQWQQQQQQQNQPNFSYQQRNRSGSFAIDLISSTTTSQVAPCHNNQTLQNFNLFKSSSHRTSHTAAAGDLLTMSHRALDPPPQQSSSNGLIVGTKKRSSTGSSDFNFVNRRTSSGGSHQQQQQHYINTTPQHSSIMQVGVGDAKFPNNNDMNQDTTSAVKNTAYVSASTMGGDDAYNDDSEHRTIRQCRRSDSFEMMDDG